MRKKNTLLVIIILTIFITISCDNSTKTDEGVVKTEIIPTTDSLKKDSIITEDPKVKSMTDTEAEKLFKTFLKSNSTLYEDKGELQELEVKGGDYTGDNITDFFYKANFYPDGADVTYPINFFYDSEKNQIIELVNGNGSDLMYGFTAIKIENGLIKGKVYLYTAINVEYAAGEFVKCDFKIIDKKIMIEKSYLKSIEKSAVKITKKLEEIQKNLDSETTE
jgi:hypothetical protein